MFLKNFRDHKHNPEQRNYWRTRRARRGLATRGGYRKAICKCPYQQTWICQIKNSTKKSEDIIFRFVCLWFSIWASLGQGNSNIADGRWGGGEGDELRPPRVSTLAEKSRFGVVLSAFLIPCQVRAFAATGWSPRHMFRTLLARFNPRPCWGGGGNATPHEFSPEWLPNRCTVGILRFSLNYVKKTRFCILDWFETMHGVKNVWVFKYGLILGLYIQEIYLKPAIT